MLQSTLGEKYVKFPPPPPPDVSFAPYMWSANSRPAVLVLLSHLSNPGGGNAQISLAPSAPPGPLTITAKFISSYIVQVGGVWGEPRSLILLMACESAATTMTTLNDFVAAFKDAGAAAIVGTEVPVYTSLATRFAEDLITALRTPDSTTKQPPGLGAAVQSVAVKLLSEGNPLGLVFTFCGNADLVLA